MNNGIKILLAFLALLTSCGNDYLVDESNVNLVQQLVYAVPERFNDDVGAHYPPTKKVYAEQGQTLKFVTGLNLNGKIITDETVSDYVTAILWNVDGEFYNISSFRHTFTESGHKLGYLEIIDQLGDTARTNFDIFVNAPNRIAIEFPYNGYNLADPSSTQKLPLRWALSGIDEWEKNTCSVFVSNNEKDVWEHELGTVDCENQVFLNGSLIGDSSALKKKGINFKDSSFTTYWAVKLVTISQSGREYRDSTEIFHFSTKTQNDSLATVKIPLSYASFRDNVPLNTKISLVSANGDTLKTLSNKEATATIVTKVFPQAGLHIYLQEQGRSEYKPESLIVDIPPRTVITTDTVIFVDKEPPQIAPSKISFGNREKLTFLLYDDGSGINPNRTKIIVKADSIYHTFSLPYLQINNPCANICYLSVIAEDFAHNTLPSAYWKITPSQDSVHVTGPFSRENP